MRVGLLIALALLLAGAAPAPYEGSALFREQIVAGGCLSFELQNMEQHAGAVFHRADLMIRNRCRAAIVELSITLVLLGDAGQVTSAAMVIASPTLHKRAIYPGRFYTRQVYWPTHGAWYTRWALQIDRIDPPPR